MQTYIKCQRRIFANIYKIIITFIKLLVNILFCILLVDKKALTQVRASDCRKSCYTASDRIYLCIYEKQIHLKEKHKAFIENALCLLFPFFLARRDLAKGAKIARRRRVRSAIFGYYTLAYPRTPTNVRAKNIPTFFEVCLDLLIMNYCPLILSGRSDAPFSSTTSVPKMFL